MPPIVGMLQPPRRCMRGGAAASPPDSHASYLARSVRTRHRYALMRLAANSYSRSILLFGSDSGVVRVSTLARQLTPLRSYGRTARQRRDSYLSRLVMRTATSGRRRFVSSGCTRDAWHSQRHSSDALTGYLKFRQWLSPSSTHFLRRCQPPHCWTSSTF